MKKIKAKNYKDDITQKIREALDPGKTGKLKPKPLDDMLEISPDINRILSIHNEQFNFKGTKHKNLYELLHSVELLTVAHNTIYKNKGASTKGTSDQTVDGISEKHILELSQKIKERKFEWSNIRKTLIPRKNKKPRPLGISNYTDKLVQFVITMILNSIYDPIFEEHNYNYGFRPNYSCQSNIIRITSYKNQGLNMAIEGDISGAFDHVNHDKLIGILKKNIEDEEFINIIHKACKAKIIQFDKLRHTKESTTPEMGTPQGYISSPILFNIYMHDFDIHITKYLTQKFEELNKERNTPLKPNETYKLIDNKIRNFRKHINKLKDKNLIQKLTNKESEHLKSLKQRISYYTKLRTKHPSRNVDEIVLRWTYSRYADDFIILTNADKKICEEIKQEIKEYLDLRLKLTLNTDKTKITNLKEDIAYFLGFSIYMSKLSPKTTETNTKMGKINRRGGSTVIKIGIDLKRRMNQLIEKQYCKIINNKPKPSHTPYLTPFKIHEIIQHYNQVMDGICNYYFRVLTNPSQLNHILYLLYYSCIFTIANKIKSSTPKIHREYEWKEYDVKRQPTDNCKLVFPSVLEYTDNQKQRIRYDTLQTYKDCLAKALRVAYNIDLKITNPHLLVNENYWKLIKVNWRSSTSIPRICIICGSPIDVEIHHTNALKKGPKHRNNKKTEPLRKFLSSINRKKIPVCHTHHQQIHQGLYNDISLKTIYDERLPRIENILRTESTPLKDAQKEKDNKNPPINRFQYKYIPDQKVIIIPYAKGKRPRYRPNLNTDNDNPTIMQKFIKNYFQAERQTDKHKETTQ